MAQWYQETGRREDAMRTRRRTMRGSIWFWVFIAVVVVLLLGILFGGYRKGTRSMEIPGPAAAVLLADGSPE